MVEFTKEDFNKYEEANDTNEMVVCPNCGDDEGFVQALTPEDICNNLTSTNVYIEHHCGACGETYYEVYTRTGIVKKIPIE